MSYILDALKKLEQKRRRETLPALTMVTGGAGVTPAPRERRWWPYLVAVSLLLNAALLLWWLRPWQSAEKKAFESQSVQRLETVQPVSAPPDTPARDEAGRPDKKSHEDASQKKSGVSQPAPEQTGTLNMPTKEKLSQSRNAGTAEQKQSGTNGPPDYVRRISSELTISGHSYSDSPAARLVIVNGRIMREGQQVNSGLKIERITPDGVMFNYQGYRFHKGVF